MADELLGDIVIDGNTVRFSDRVGNVVTTEQSEVLRRTAEALGKFAINDRYPADSMDAHVIEVTYGALDSWKYQGRNEHGLPVAEQFDRNWREFKRLFGE